MPKYFHAESIGRKPGDVTWEPIGIFGGCLMGCYTPENAKEEAALLALSKSPTSGVSEVTEAEYLRSKKSPVETALRTQYPSRDVSPPVTVFNAALKGLGNVVPVSGPADAPLASTEEEKALDLDSVLKVEKV